MGLIRCALVLSLLAAAPVRGDDPVPEFFTGRAVTRTGKLWYTEEHTVRKKDGRIQVETRYLAANGALMAEMWTDVGKRRYLPHTRLIDHRDQYGYTVEPLANGREVRVVETTGRQRPERATTLAMSDGLMTFQGALWFVTDELESLQRGRKFVIRYLVPSRMTAYDVRVYKRSLEGNVLTVRMEMEGVGYRLLTTPMDLKIDTKARRILEFTGASNLLDEHDRMARVRITYSYR